MRISVALFLLSTLLLGSSLQLAADPFENGYVPPEQLEVPEGLEISVWAHTPELYNPISMDVDEQGRIWVIEGMTYGPEHPPLREEGDRVVVLEDTDGDGSADTSQVFLQDQMLETAMGVAVFGNRVLVSKPPALHMFVDVNRNQKYEPDVDRYEKLLTGFAGLDHGHGLHELNAGPGGRWYLTAGNKTVGNITGTDGRTFFTGSFYNGQEFAGRKSADGHAYYGGAAYRINPDGSGLQVVAHNMRNPVGWYVDSFGRFFNNDNDDPPACRATWVMKYGNMGYASVHSGTRHWQADKKPWEDHASAHWHQTVPGAHPSGHVYDKRGAPAGLTVYENGTLGKTYRGRMISAEPQQSLVFSYRPKREGAGYALERSTFIDGTTKQANNWFRPSDVTVGADGAIYVSDWYDNTVGGHAWNDHEGRGAIYRITRKGNHPDQPDVHRSSIQGMIEMLKSPANNVRFLGFERLVEKGDEARPALENLLQSQNPFLAARALWPLAQISEAGRKRVRTVLLNEDRSDRLRVAAFRALQVAGTDLLSLAKTLSTDPSPAVRRVVAIAMRDVPFNKSRAVLLNIAERFNGNDRWYLEAFGTGCSGKRTKVYNALKKQFESPARWSWSTARLVWRLRTPAAVDALKSRALSNELEKKHRRLAIDSLAYIYHASAAQAMVDVVGQMKVSSLYDRAKWYLNHHRSFQWSEYDIPLPEEQKKIFSELNDMTGEEFSVVSYLDTGPNKPITTSSDAPEITVKRGVSSDVLTKVDPLLEGTFDGIEIVESRESNVLDVVVDNDKLVLGISSLNPNKRYKFGFTWWDYNNDGRVHSVHISSGDRRQTLLPATPLPAYHDGKKQPPEPRNLTIPQKFVDEGEFDIVIRPEGPTNVIISEVWLMEADATTSSGDATVFKGTFPAAEKLASRNGDPERGKKLFFGRATCFTCHQRGDRGRRFGPELNNLSKSKASIIDSIINPSAGIAQGYQTTTVKKTDGSEMRGLLMSSGDPVVLKIAGGNRQTIPREQIESVETSSESLMPAARQLNLNPQDLVDLAAYLSAE